MDILRSAKKILFYLFIVMMLAGVFSCASSRKNFHNERPKKGKMKPCGCPNFGQYNISYVAIDQTC